jgi:hypothetical protein
MLQRSPRILVESPRQPDLDRNRQRQLNQVAHEDSSPDPRLYNLLPCSKHRQHHPHQEDRHGKEQTPPERRAPLSDLFRLAEGVELGRVDGGGDDGVEAG